MPLLHDLADFSDLITVVAADMKIDSGLVEKDYWIMHALWGLQQLGFRFELKGGTSLSKGYQLIHRFSEDIDILIHPQDTLPTGRNHDKPVHIEQRREFFNGLVPRLDIPGFLRAERDQAFDDPTGRMRGAGIRLIYRELNPLPAGLKAGVLLEAGFDRVAPNQARLISSWAYDRAVASDVPDLIDNRAIDVLCYEPGYTFVEKLQTLSTKFRQQQASGEMPVNFMRHYYDVSCLLEDDGVQAFIGSPAYRAHKADRFRGGDEPDLRRNEAFRLSEPTTRQIYADAYERTRALYYRDRPSLDAILTQLDAHLDRL
ncbi:nucleotidyl transferase AbiEii/AbiGii toxin family protein [Mesorhizobium sp. WSM3626]|uniref:nucleotidyl transferase AbiEii/AbiGii toxin family protein n=1 Tax=Mesorhizobium sp. WSM3626 TaxID=1040987 RepID=UPI0004899D6E|nr:nucleotidyl transferase AbiEii/AbiGii toxin family protein [Mesorhizobium sp. WSM3626]